MSELQQMISWGFQALLLGVAAYAVSTMRSLKNSVDALNLNVAVLISKNEGHEKEFDRVNSRLDRLETREN
jgi:hypothetical protein